MQAAVAFARDTTKNEPRPKNKAKPLDFKNKTVPTATMKTVPRTTKKSEAVPRMATHNRTKPRTTTESEAVLWTTNMSGGSQC